MNSFGRLFKVQIFGESHSKGIGAIIDGCPSGIELDYDLIYNNLLLRKGDSFATTPRKEEDKVVFFSGVKNGKTTGTPISFVIENKNIVESKINLKETPRPGHADFTQISKYGNNADISGGGHSSGRLTTALVVAGTIAQSIIPKISFNCEIDEIGGEKDYDELLSNIAEKGDSLGGIVKCKINGVPAGLGEPFFDSIESNLSHILFSIPGVKGIEFGAGFNAAKMLGSEMNDELINIKGKTKTNNSGGIVGGITNGNEIIFRVAFRPPSSIKLKQKTVNLITEEINEIAISGRNDICYVLRTPIIIECVAAISIVDFMLLEGLIPRKN
ncbi:MAG: chorismate synthase [Candidatus Kapaibacteriota bacterium]